VELQLHAFLTWHWVEVNGGLNAQQLSSREESPGYPLNKMLGGTNSGTDVLMKKKFS